MYAIVDLVTILPVLVTIADLSEEDDLSAPRTFSVSFLRVVRVLRILRVLRVYRLLRFSENSYRNQLLTLIFTIACLIICWTGIIQAAEGADVLPFHTAFYFTMITLTTVRVPRGRCPFDFA